jgi:transcriptional regulator with XRE-family HTH domain
MISVLRRERQRRSMNQIEFAALCGLHQADLSRIENRRETVGIRRAKRLCQVLALSWDELLDNDGIVLQAPENRSVPVS